MLMSTGHLNSIKWHNFFVLFQTIIPGWLGGMFDDVITGTFSHTSLLSTVVISTVSLLPNFCLSAISISKILLQMIFPMKSYFNGR